MRCLGIGLLLACMAQAGDRSSLRILHRHGLSPTASSIGGYLRTYGARGTVRRRIRRLIARLADADPSARASAARNLRTIGRAALHALKQTETRRDPEQLRWMSALLREATLRVEPDLLAACFRIIHIRRLGGLAKAVLIALPVCEEEFVQIAGCDALRTTCGPPDAPTLQDAIRHDSGKTRYAAVIATGSLLGRSAAPMLRNLLRHADDHVRVGAARALAELGDRASRVALAELLGSTQAWVRMVSAQTLRDMSGERHGYASFDPPARRAKAAGRWRGAIASLSRWATPLARRPLQLGRTLVSDWTGGRVIELDDAGRVVWELGNAQGPWANSLLADGHRLVTFYKAKAVVEYDRAGREVWRRDHLPGNPVSVQRLASGNTLLACGASGRGVIELDPRGRIVSRLPLKTRPTDVRVLPNRNLLLTLTAQSAVVEVRRRSGQVVWRLDNLRSPTSAQPLENGNVLVCEPGAMRVVEYTRRRKVVWSRAGLPGSISAQRLPSGMTLVASRNGVRLIDPDGNTHWSRRFAGHIWASGR